MSVCNRGEAEQKMIIFCSRIIRVSEYILGFSCVILRRRNGFLHILHYTQEANNCCVYASTSLFAFVHNIIIGASI